MVWTSLFAVKENAIGEVACVRAGEIDIFVYPEHYSEIRVGSIIAINSDQVKPVGLAVNIAHEPRHGSIHPLRKGREEILREYPDIDYQHRLVLTVVYSSHVKGNTLYHVPASMPRLHDLAFLVNSNDLLDAFFRPNGEWNFDFLRYVIEAGAQPLTLRGLFFTHRDYFLSKDPNCQSLVRALARPLYMADPKNVGRYLECILEALR
ncbi:MAG: hypothetical protein QXY55_06255 [Candidatus Korarchaeota archaeon]